jgi:hypothetical protein
MSVIIFLASVYITQPMDHITLLDHEAEDNVILINSGIYLQNERCRVGFQTRSKADVFPQR